MTPVERLAKALAGPDRPTIGVVRHWERYTERAQDALSADPALAEAIELGLAFAADVAALPEDWELELSVGKNGRRDLFTASATYCHSLRHYRENVGRARSTPFEMAHAATPAEALRNLAAKLNP